MLEGIFSKKTASRHDYSRLVDSAQLNDTIVHYVMRMKCTYTTSHVMKDSTETAAAAVVTRNMPKVARPPLYIHKNTLYDINCLATTEPIPQQAAATPITSEHVKPIESPTGIEQPQERHVSVLFTWKDQTTLSATCRKFKLLMPMTTPIVNVLRACARMMNNVDMSMLALVVVRTGRFYTARSSTQTTVDDMCLTNNTVIRITRLDDTRYGLSTLIGMNIRIPIMKGAPTSSYDDEVCITRKQRWQYGRIVNVAVNVLVAGVRVRLNSGTTTTMPLHQLFVQHVQPIRPKRMRAH